MPDIVLRPCPRPIDAIVRLPGSKSLTNRALLLAALAEGRSELEHVLVAEDSRLMVAGLRGLGVNLVFDEAGCRAIVHGCGGRWPQGEAEIFCGNAGTVARFLTAACCLGYGDYTLDGVARMRERPIGPLIDALNDLGASVSYAGREGYLPVNVAGHGLRGGKASFREAASSQFLSAVLMAAPLARQDVMIEVEGPLVSEPFVRMTLGLMERFGASVVEQRLRRFIVPGMQHYAAGRLEIEPDATAASYFLAAAALSGGRVTVEGLGEGSAQGDLDFVRVLERMGCTVRLSPRSTTVTGPADGALRGGDVDLGGMPDTAPTLAVLAAFAEGPTRIRNVANLRIKETDRLAALATELARLGAETEIHPDGLTVRPAAPPRAAAIETYGDHRMAMSFALTGLRLDDVTIRDAECVGKTFPGFFDVWRRAFGDS